MIISIQDFAATGKFGPVQLGMSTVEVTSLLGKPTYSGVIQDAASGALNQSTGNDTLDHF